MHVAELCVGVLASLWALNNAYFIRRAARTGEGLMPETLVLAMLSVVSVVAVLLLGISTLHLAWLLPVCFALAASSAAFPLSLLIVPGRRFGTLCCLGLGRTWREEADELEPPARAVLATATAPVPAPATSTSLEVGRQEPVLEAPAAVTQDATSTEEPAGPIAAEQAPASEPAPTTPTTGHGRESRSYIIRHWRGELSLERSYWINMGLLGIPIGVAAQLLSKMDESDFADAPRIISAVMLAFLVSYAIVSTWQAVGVWRSAKAHIAATGRRFWARGAQLVSAGNVLGLVVQGAVLAPLAWHLGHFVAGIDTMPPATVRTLGGGREIEITGTLGFGTADRVADLLKKNPKVRTLRLTSQGGRMGEAHKLRTLVARRKLDTYVSVGCYSACTAVFLGGAARVVHRDAHLGFHRPGLPGVMDAMWDQQVEDDAKVMLAAGVDATFVQHAKSTPNAQMWEPSTEELIAAHFATRVSDGSEFAIVATNERVARDEIESALLKTRLFRVLKVYEPAVYADGIKLIDRVVKNGGTLGDVRGRMLPQIAQVLAKRLPTASDDALIEFGRHVVTAMTTLERADPALCYGYLFPGQTKESPLAHLPGRLIDEETEVMASIIESSATAPGRPVSATQLQQVFQQLGTRLAKRLGQDQALAIFNTVQRPQENKLEVCAAMTTIYEEVLTLPHAQAGLALRGLTGSAA